MELLHAAYAVMDEQWQHTALLAATVANIFAEHPISPVRFHPFHAQGAAAHGDTRHNRPMFTREQLLKGLENLK